jgi:G3E family GTPase
VVASITSWSRPRGSPIRCPWPGWQTWRFETSRTLSDARLEEFLRALPRGLYRVKGLGRTDAGWVAVHAVGGRYEVEPCTPPAEPPASVLIGVGHDFDRAALDVAAAALTV